MLLTCSTKATILFFILIISFSLHSQSEDEVDIPLEIQADTVIRTDFIVETGQTCIIRSRVLFYPSIRLIVERGAKLSIEGGTLTNACNGLWQGIELRGNACQPQNIAYQGVVEVLNGGTIENAVCGIRTIKMQPDEEGVDPDYSGGIIWADNAGFINNKTAVEFYSYPGYQSIS
ncbi:MAG: hypothetical protein JXA03_03725, partial [Bacteroidales bacterium]|nr:hypothetical protein [Bacteroidales bacterium]